MLERYPYRDLKPSQYEAAKRRDIKYEVLSHRFDKRSDRRHQKCIVKIMLVFVRYPSFISLAIAAENSKLKYIKAFL